MADDTQTTTDTGWGASRWFGAAGGVLASAGLVAVVMVWSEMADSDVGYSTVDKWLAVLAGLTVVGVGLTVAALGAVIARLGD